MVSMEHDNSDEEDARQSGFQNTTFASIRVDEDVGSASISPSGRDIVLASRQGLHIIDLDSPWSLPRHLPHHTLWEVADVQWSPFASRDYWVVSTSNQKALVWNLEMSTFHAPIEHVLHAHSRAITDINFSAHHPDLLATCAVDSFVHCWDLRQPTRPAFSFCDWFAGATQVKWSRQDSHVVASSHDRFLRIWDARKGVYPLRSIDAHATKIYGLDWNRTRASSIVTCSLDKTVKFWDFSRPNDEPERIIRAPFPVWRARHTPFGSGILAMPQRGNHDLHLYDCRSNSDEPKDAATTPVHSFTGHHDQVKEFLWRQRGNISDGRDHREFQLVSWGSDKELRLHRLDKDCLRAVGYEKGMQVSQNMQFTRRGAVYKTFKDQYHLTGNSGSLPRVSSDEIIPRNLLTEPSNTTAENIFGENRSEAGFMTFPGVHARNYRKKGVNLITWMKGVKVEKRKGTSISGDQDSGKLLAPSIPREPALWGSAENLGDEITQVGDKFKEITFEQVDMPNRTATVSLNGPWDSDGRSLHMRAIINFPLDYPKKSMAYFKLEKTSTISDELLSKLSAEAQEISEIYQSREQGCLKAVMRYLLGDRNLEESKAWLNEQISFTHEEQLEESSSDEEDCIGADFNGSQSQNLEISGTEVGNPVSANANVPLPKACGATWAHEGRLVCFFPPKEEKKLLVDGLILRDNDRSFKSPRIFEGFGRLNTDSPEPKYHARSPSTTNDENSDSENSYLSGSSSESSDGINELPTRFRPPAAWRGTSFRMHRTRSTERSQQSGSIATMSRSFPVKSKSVISLHWLDEYLPSKKQLAKEYKLFGDGPSVCSHNAHVAEKYGYRDLADIWNFAKLILMNEVPLEIIERPQRKDQILILVRRGLVRIRRRDSVLDLASDNNENVKKPKIKGRVKWGGHPFARIWLIEELFTYFEYLADVQMLAMLSCIFWEPEEKEAISTANLHPLESDLPLSMKSPAFSFDYFPSFKAACSTQSINVSKPITPGSYQASSGNRGSVESSNGFLANGSLPNESLPSINADVSPPSSFRRHASSTGHSLAGSPEQKHQRFRRSAVNLNVPFSMSASTSPPDLNRVTEADDELSTSAPSRGITWGMNTILNATLPANAGNVRLRRDKSTENNIHSRSNISNRKLRRYESDSDSDGAESLAFAQKGKARIANEDYSIAISLKNQMYFDQEATASAPLLDPQNTFKYQAYRRTYAHLLFIWGLTMQRCELLSFNGLRSYWADRWPPAKFDNERILQFTAEGDAGALDGLRRSSAKDEALQVSVVCSRCGNGTSNTEGKPQMSGEIMRDRCVSCLRYAARIQCSVCWEPIQGLYKICIECGHATHADCTAANSLNELEFDFSMFCETGCGCNCAAHDESLNSLQKLIRDEDLQRKSSAASKRWETNKKREQDKKQKNVPRKGSGAGLSRGLRQSFVMAVKGGRQ